MAADGIAIVGSTTQPVGPDYYANAYFTILAERYERLTRFARTRIRNVLETSGVGDFLPRARVLDLGCGIGTFAHEFASRGARAVGLDFAPTALREARRIGKRARKRVRPGFSLGSAEHLPFRDRCFDLVVAADFTEHLELRTLRLVFDEALRVLTPGGRFVVYTPNPDHVFERLRRLHILTPDPSHSCILPSERLVHELRRAGFGCRRVFHRPSHLPAFNLLERLLAPLPWIGRLFRRRICIRAVRPAPDFVTAPIAQVQDHREAAQSSRPLVLVEAQHSPVAIVLREE